MKDKVIDAVGDIDNDMIEKTDALRQKKHIIPVWFRWCAAAACLALIVIGITVAIRPSNVSDEAKHDSAAMDSAENNTSAVLPDENNENTQGSTDGVYIPAVELPKNTDGISYDMLALVVYKGGIYTQAESYFDADAENIDALVGEYLGYATGSINEWSTQDEYAEEFASSVAGDVYAVKGYDTDFRICIRAEYENENGEKSLWIQFLDRLNDITLKTGADLFETRLHLTDRVTEIRYQSHDDWNWAKGNIQTADIHPELWKEFINQIDLADFIYTWDPKNSANTVYDTENQAHLSLVMDDSTVIPLRLIEGGYVGYDPMGWYFVQIPCETFDAVFTACGGVK